MNPEIKQKWVEALRSGKYKQGEGFLRTGDAYCCLGVLCDVIDPSQWDGLNNYQGACKLLPDHIAVDLNISTDTQEHLADINDSNTPFSEIADEIEATL